MLRRSSGPATGLYAGSTNAYNGNGFSAAVDPETGELYVYNTTLDGHGVQVSVFAAGASGNTAPLRVISGSNTGIGQPGYLGANKIAVASDERLFVSEQNNKVLVFAPGAAGDTAPAQTIQDSTPGAGTNVGGIAARSCRCR